MATLEERAGEVKDFVEQVYKIFKVDNARASATIIYESGEVNLITSFFTAEPAKVTVDYNGNVEITLRKSRLFLEGMMFNLLKLMIKTGMEENGYHLREEKFFQETFVLLDFTFST